MIFLFYFEGRIGLSKHHALFSCSGSVEGSGHRHFSVNIFVPEHKTGLYLYIEDCCMLQGQG